MFFHALTPSLQILSRISAVILPLTCERNVDPLHTNLPPVFQGCFELVTSFIETNMAIIAGVTFGIAFSQVGGGNLPPAERQTRSQTTVMVKVQQSNKKNRAFLSAFLQLAIDFFLKSTIKQNTEIQACCFFKVL